MKPYMGNVFKTLKEGEIFYREYGVACGFETHMTTLVKYDDDTIVRCYIMFNKEGIKKIVSNSASKSIKSITMYYDNSNTVANSKELMTHMAIKDIERKYHIIQEIVNRGDMQGEKICTTENMSNLFTKSLLQRVIEGNLRILGLHRVGKIVLTVCFD